MLDLVLAWASLDGALGMLYSQVADIPMHEGADLIAREKNTAVMARILRETKGTSKFESMKKLIRPNKRKYEKFSTSRNLIAHAKCVGFSKHDNDFVVFATFEKVGNDQLAVDAIPVQEMRRATEWAELFQKELMEIVDSNECQ